MKGDVTCSIMTIEEGGVLDGSSRMVGGHTSKPDFEARALAKKQPESNGY